jgi:hypothetical protein
MEGVAPGAQTGKAAVDRRRPSKEDLVVDALRTGLPRMEEAPDLGSVREDLLALGRGPPGHVLPPGLRAARGASRMRSGAGGALP